MTDDVERRDAMAALIVQTAVQFAEGKSRVRVVADLQQDGFPSDFAEFVADRALELKKDEFRKQGQSTAAIGAVMLAGGALITALTYSVSQSSGFVVVMSGLMFGGFLMIVKGVWRMTSG